MESPRTFAEEINYNELEFREVVGKGAFGLVRRALWRNKDVAVKLIQTESEKKAFITELKQLSRVCHTNIVRLYGACTKSPVCLVMEYAEGGSLYNVLHGTKVRPVYTTSHAISWCLQCAKGVEYLHKMTPKALIHRDLKPPNLLVILGGTVLKICDFGTACDQQTHMTNNKGSAAWMAPEVFEGCNYTEKCDIFSFGIILWEVLTRLQPFHDIGGPAFRIMWAVHSGTRPPLIKDLPPPLEQLMTSCWSNIAHERPSMSEVVRVLESFMPYFTGHKRPLEYQTLSDEVDEDYEDTEDTYNEPTVSTTVTSYNSAISIATGPSQPNYVSQSDTARHGFISGYPSGFIGHQQPVIVEEDLFSNLKSAPASLASSRESLDSRTPRSGTPTRDTLKRYSADLSKLEEVDTNTDFSAQYIGNKKLGHRRSGSYGTSVAVDVPYNPSPPRQLVDAHRRIGLDELRILRNTPMLTQPVSASTAEHTGTENTFLANRSVSWTPGVPINVPLDHIQNMTELSAILDSQLQPIAPAPSSPESLAIFQQHFQVLQEYLKVQVEIQLLLNRRQELLTQCEKNEQSDERNYKMIDEYRKLTRENKDLKLYHSNLKRQQRARSQSFA